MRIVHVMNWYIPGMGYQENFLQAEQKRLGHDVKIVASTQLPSDLWPQFLPPEISHDSLLKEKTSEENGVMIYRTRGYRFRDSALVLNLGVVKKLRELKPDVVQAHGAFTISALISILYSRRLNYSIFVDDHCHERYTNTTTPLMRIYLRFVRMFLRFFGDRVGRFMPINESSKAVLQKVLKVPENQIQIVPLGVQTSRFTKSAEMKAQGRKTIGVGEGEFLVIFAGKLDVHKKVELLMKAFSEVAAKDASMRLLILGSGPGSTGLKRTADSLGIADRTKFMDLVPNSELPLYYNAADLGIWPSSPTITVLEAVCTGLPVIVPDDEPAYKILYENHAVTTFERGNVESLAKAIERLVKDESLRSSLSSAGLSLGREVLSWTKIAGETIEIYSSGVQEVAGPGKDAVR